MTLRLGVEAEEWANAYEDLLKFSLYIGTKSAHRWNNEVVEVEVFQQYARLTWSLPLNRKRFVAMCHATN